MRGCERTPCTPPGYGPEVRNKTHVKRKAPKQRHEAVVKKARKQLKADSEVESPDVLSENDSSLYDFKDMEPPTRDQSTQTLSKHS